ncbi:hypothetical protein RFI_17566 [Reticulomyxa filosa]|uniref:Uncharacterized protein n=1 Tax=Reticulomyxa filosa TaxID=46433 RepID=X6N056_RETFI|nr:hypothetical protein RFI_17566 [Reticulomyxa filosa]|eukprot:ETO19665.1 hypothetical protein RFI_17566 [Reticulomyxa filosa]
MFKSSMKATHSSQPYHPIAKITLPVDEFGAALFYLEEKWLLQTAFVTVKVTLPYLLELDESCPNGSVIVNPARELTYLTTQQRQILYREYPSLWDFLHSRVQLTCYKARYRITWIGSEEKEEDITTDISLSSTHQSCPTQSSSSSSSSRQGKKQQKPSKKEAKAKAKAKAKSDKDTGKCLVIVDNGLIDNEYEIKFRVLFEPIKKEKKKEKNEKGLLVMSIEDRVHICVPMDDKQNAKVLLSQQLSLYLSAITQSDFDTYSLIAMAVLDFLREKLVHFDKASLNNESTSTAAPSTCPIQSLDQAIVFGCVITLNAHFAPHSYKPNLDPVL